LTRAYDNNGRCPRQKFVFGILQLKLSVWAYSFILLCLTYLSIDSFIGCKLGYSAAP